MTPTFWLEVEEFPWGQEGHLRLQALTTSIVNKNFFISNFIVFLTVFNGDWRA